jgi:hypothetical protein
MIERAGGRAGGQGGAERRLEALCLRPEARIGIMHGEIIEQRIHREALEYTELPGVGCGAFGFAASRARVLTPSEGYRIAS